MTTVAVVVVALTVIAPSAQALTIAQRLKPAVSLGPGRDAAAAVDALGRTTAVWVRPKRGKLPADMVWAQLGRNGRWSSLKQLAGSAGSGNTFGRYPQVAVASDGAAILAWHGADGSIRAMVRSSATTAFGAAKQLAPNLGRNRSYSGLSVAIGAGGRGVVAWANDEIGAVRVEGGSFGPAQSIVHQDGDSVQDVTAAADDGGDAVLLFRSSHVDETATSGASALVQATLDGTDWTTSVVEEVTTNPRDVTPAPVHEFAFEANPSGDLVAAWVSACTDSTSCSDHSFVAAARGTVAEGLDVTTIQRLSNPGVTADDPAAHIDGAGNRAVAWQQGAYPTERTWAAGALPGAPFSPGAIAGLPADSYSAGSSDLARGVLAFVPLTKAGRFRMTEASVPSIAPRWITSAPVSGKVAEAESELRLAANGGATLLWSSFGRSSDSVTLFARTTLVRR